MAFLSCLYGGALVKNSPDEPGWGIVYIETPAGQMSWHVHPGDFELFNGLTVVDSYKWDGHSTKEKYFRLNVLGRMHEKALKDVHV